MKLHRPVAVLATLVAVLAASACGRTDEDTASVKGVGKDEIVIGGTFPLTGPLAVTGTLSNGFAAYLGKVNAEGGVNGRKLRFVKLDDAYDPSRVAANARRLVQQEKVFMIADFGGPPLAIRDFLESNKTPQFIMGGLSAFGDPKYTYTRAWWPDSSWEAALYTKQILKADPKAKIGTLMLDNDLGKDLTAGIRRALGGDDGALVKETSYGAADVDVSSQVNQLRAAGVTSIVAGMAGAAQVAFVKYVHQIGWKPDIYMYGGGVIGAPITKAMGSAAKGLRSGFWLKDPADPRYADSLKEYEAAVARYGGGARPTDGYVLNGYGAAEAVVAALKTMDDPTPDGFVKALDGIKPTTIDALSPGMQLKPSPGQHVVGQYQPVRFDGTAWQLEGSPVSVADAGLAGSE